MAALRTVVGALDRPEQVLPMLRDLGGATRVTASSRNTTRPSERPDLDPRAGPRADFTAATRRAWMDAYSLLAWTMIAAAEAEVREQLAA